jgi:hypothetical protein
VWGHCLERIDRSSTTKISPYDGMRLLCNNTTDAQGKDLGREGLYAYGLTRIQLAYKYIRGVLILMGRADCIANSGMV